MSPDIDASATSTMWTPHSMAEINAAMPLPLVSCMCRWMGTRTVRSSRSMSKEAARGRSSPAMSLMQRKWVPMSSARFARSA